MDEVFRALADPTRRSLLDELFKQDGQSLSALEQRLPMTRFGVMKHLRVLEEAGLDHDQAARSREAALPEPRPDPARPRPVGEQVRRAMGRRAQRAQATTGGHTMEKVFEIYIKTTPERLWEAITDSELRQQVQLRRGRRLRLDDRLALRGRSRDGVGPARRGREPRGRSAAPARAELHRAVERGVKSEGTSRVTWEIEPVGDSCRLTVTHDQLREGANSELYGGWPMILSGLKTLLETGETLTTPGSLRYAQAPQTAA